MDIGKGYELSVCGMDIGSCGCPQPGRACLPGPGFLDKIQSKEAGDGIVEIADLFPILLGGLIGAALPLVFWIAAMIFAIIMLRRVGGRAERFLVAGVGIEMAGTLLRIPAGAITPWLFHQGYSTTYINSISTGCGIFLNVISMAGIICFIYAFWVKFKAKSYNIAESVNEEQIEEVAT